MATCRNCKKEGEHGIVVSKGFEEHRNFATRLIETKEKQKCLICGDEWFIDSNSTKV